MRSPQFLLLTCILLMAATVLARRATTIDSLGAVVQNASTITAVALIGVIRAVKALDSQSLTARNSSMQTAGMLQDCLRAL